jgi:hypothetical protein
VAAFDPAFASLVSAGLRANPFSFRGAAPVQPSQQTQKGLKWALQNLDQNLGAAAGIPAMPAFGGQAVTPGFDTQNLFAKSRTLGSTPVPSGRGATPVVQAADEEYKALLSQYGGTSGVQQLAGMQSLPTGFTPTGGKQAANLEDYYAAQRAVGAKNIGEITGALAASDPRYQKGGTLERWAIANPDLAMREFNKKFPAGAPTQGTGQFVADPALQGTTGSFLPGDQAVPTTNAPSLAGQTSFGNIANPVAPTRAWNQGAMVDANRGKENLVPQQEAKTTPDGTMPNLETTAKPPTVLNRTGNFLNDITPFIKAIAPTGLSSIIYNPYQ